MKRLALLLVLLLTVTFVAGCNKTPPSKVDNQPAKTLIGSKDTADFGQYKGDWKLKVAGDEELYRMTALEKYLGSTGINIAEANNGQVKGKIYSIQGPPSYRQAEVDFTGKIADGKLSAAYMDEGWLYSGNIKLTFVNDKIIANITRDKSDTAPMWGIPEGEFTFLKSINTEKMNMSEQEKKTMEQFFIPTAKDAIKPFAEGTLTDEMMIKFVSYNLAMGWIDTSKYGNKVENKTDISFDKSVVDDIARQYFGKEVKTHKTFDIATYKNGKYTVPALGGLTKSPRVQILQKDTENKGIYYAIVDYMFSYPEGGEKLEYQYLIKLQKDNGYTIKAIKEIESPINFALFK